MMSDHIIYRHATAYKVIKFHKRKRPLNWANNLEPIRLCCKSREWIYLVTEKGVQARCLKPGEAPTADFRLVDDKPLLVFEHCNKHGLWKKAL